MAYAGILEAPLRAPGSNLVTEYTAEIMRPAQSFWKEQRDYTSHCFPVDGSKIHLLTPHNTVTVFLPGHVNSPGGEDLSASQPPPDVTENYPFHGTDPECSPYPSALSRVITVKRT